jgi:glycosyltransferase involved in cell wall biosynthesis
MTKVLALVTFKILPPEMGGQKGVALFYKHLQKYLSIDLAVSKNNKVDSYEGIHVLPFLYPNKQIYRNLLLIGRLVRLTRKHKIECMVCEHSYTGWIGWLLNRKLKIPFIIHSHNIEASRFRQMKYSFWKYYSRYEKWIHKKADFNFFKTPEDMVYAISNYQVSPQKAGVLPYGVETIQKLENAPALLRKELNPESQYILYFNGTLDYYPNLEAVQVLVNEIAPLLDKQGLDYKIVITGKNCPATLSNLMADCSRIIYKGFVENINLYYQGADVFLNPVVNDAGVKTKLVEALVNGCKVVSTISGARGINTSLAAGQLKIVADSDWQSFTNAIIEEINRPNTIISSGFCNYYSWEAIAEAAANKIKEVILK